MEELQLSEKERLQNLAAWNEKRKVLRQREETEERMFQDLKAYKRSTNEFRNFLFGISPDRFDEDDLPLLTEDTLTPAGYAEIKIDLDSGANTFNLLMTQVQERLKKNEFDAFAEYFLNEAMTYKLDTQV